MKLDFVSFERPFITPVAAKHRAIRRIAHKCASSRRMVLALASEDLVFLRFAPRGHPSQGLVETHRERELTHDALIVSFN